MQPSHPLLNKFLNILPRFSSAPSTMLWERLPVKVGLTGIVCLTGFILVLFGLQIKLSHLLVDTEPVPAGMLSKTNKNLLTATTDIDSWACKNHGNAFSYIREEKGTLVAHIDALDKADEDVQLYQEDVDLKPGHTYVLRFCARAETYATATLSASNDQGDYEDDGLYDVGLHRTITLKPRWCAYCYLFEASEAANRHNRVPFFYLGHQRGRVWLADVTLAEVGDPSNTHAMPTFSDKFYADSIRRQCDYIADCSWSQWSANHTQADKNKNSPAYGVLNDVRINVDENVPGFLPSARRGGADYVRPGEAAMGVVGLMAGVSALDQGNQGYSPEERERYLRVISLFFKWVDRTQNPDGSFSGAITYDINGQEDRTQRGTESVDVTAQVVIAEYKYSEYFNNVNWLRDNWNLAEKAGSWLLDQPQNGQTVDESYRCAALRCLAAWASSLGKPDPYSQAADAGSARLWEMADAAPGPYAFRRYLDGNGHATYGDKFDNICYAPFETGALDEKMSRPGDISGTPYGALISDWWTQNMTYQSDPSQGTLLMKYNVPNAWNARLSPGGSLELAKVEWRVGRKDRARARFYWVARSSGLTNAVTEARVAGGILDWRQNSALSAQTPKGSKTAAPWERFIDTSAYFIEVARMLWQDQDTKYIPENSKNKKD